MHPVFAVNIIFLTLGELFMLFMLFLPKAETIFMKGIYDNVRMVLTFGGAIFILFIWVRFVEKTFFIHWLLEREMDEKVKRCVNRVCIYFNASYSTIINGECEIVSTTYYLNSNSRNSRISSCILIQGATEEIIVRGWLFPVLSVRSRIWVGIIVTSFLFGFLHLLNPGITILSISNIILVGVFAALYVLKEDGLWGICAWHSIWNWAQYNVYGFAVSGTTVYSILSL